MSPTFSKNPPQEIFAGRLETFLTCLAVTEKLRENFLDDTTANFFAEKSLQAICKSLQVTVTISEVELLLSELPNILQLKYSAVEEVREACLNIIPRMMDLFRRNNMWKNFVELDYLQRILKAI